MEPVVVFDGVRVFEGDCREVLKVLPDSSVDSVVTDPPYELGFMGKRWDSSGVAYDVSVWRECLRVLKPGGHLLAFGGSRTFHRLAVAIEDAGFEVRDTIAWISSKTFPKSLNIEKAMGKSGLGGSVALGWGTGLKQVVEPVVMARKPLEGTVAQNFDRWGVGGLNIDESRIASGEMTGRKQYESKVWRKGRWPANVILDEVSAGLLDEQSGKLKPATSRTDTVSTGMFAGGNAGTIYPDSGGASRFFYVAKASKRDRNEGLDDSNAHPTVKPTALMGYLIKLVTPPGGVVLDPFTGSGSTGKAAVLEGFEFVGVELTAEYLPIIEGRLKWAFDNRGDNTLF